ncbi:MAG: fumarate hydratase C-terminal domain-containing protein [Kiritimatiellae bacterium]|nr:fumarate hydratase C-terminal domain-containing protein [Kiritimatiellia bacterium]
MDLAALDVRSLKLGETLLLDGIVHTGRDRFHKYLHDGGELPPGVDLKTSALYHCGPVMVPQTGADGTTQWRMVAGGPTTSSREEPYEADVIARFGLRIIIGKGGMGPRTLAACQQYGCVYLQAVGGAATSIANAVECVEGVDFLDTFGAAEAMWHLRVRNFPVTVAMDAHGNSLYQNVQERSAEQLAFLLAR